MSLAPTPGPAGSQPPCSHACLSSVPQAIRVLIRIYFPVVLELTNSEA